MVINPRNKGAIHTVILAAGSSRRLGFNKLTVKIDGEAVIRRAAGPFVEASLGDVIVVTGGDTYAVEEALKGLAVRMVSNRDHLEGMSTSIRTALPFIRGARAVFFHLGDKPFIEKELIHAMVDSHLREGNDIIVPVFRGTKGHPVLVNIMHYESDMGLLEGDKGFREVIEKNSSDVLFIEGNEGVLFDIDTLEDIEILRERGHKVEEGQS